MPARLPIGTLARASRSKRRPGVGRRLFRGAVFLSIIGVTAWYFGFRKESEPEVAPVVAEAEVDEVLPPEPPATGAPPAENSPITTAPLFSATPGVATRSTAAGASSTPEPQQPAPTPAPVLIEKDFRPRPPKDVFEAQIAMARDAICPGSIDGAWGGQTRRAVAAYQQKHGLKVTGQLDNATRDAMMLREPPLTTYVVTDEDVARLRQIPKGWLARSELDRLDYSTVLELVSEKSSTNPKHLQRLNPGLNWGRVGAGTEIVVPRVARTGPTTRPEMILISLTAKTLQLYDAESRLLAHFPCSIARRVDKRIPGEIVVVTTAPNPNYTFDPANFPDSVEAQKIGRKLTLQPGPNNPVGTAWITLSPPAAGLSNYGIHGSPEPEQIGRTESSGCFRLSNWNAEYLVPLVRAGMPVQIEP